MCLQGLFPHLLDTTRGQITIGAITPIRRAALAAVGKKARVSRVAITVMNMTLASGGRPAIYNTASATYFTSNVGSGFIVRSACNVPLEIPPVKEVSALPMSIWPQAISYARPSSAIVFVSPEIACLDAAYAAIRGRGTEAAIEPLLMILPPRGC